jgi:hypothetical protein
LGGYVFRDRRPRHAVTETVITLVSFPMDVTHFPLWYRLHHTDGYLIWFSAEPDGVVTLDDQTVPSFRSLAALTDYAAQRQLDLATAQPLCHDLDHIEAWLQHPLHAAIDCTTVLTAWNLFDDLATSLRATIELDRARSQPLYEKLFWGNNLPSVTPPAKHFTPAWDDDERLLLRDVLAAGLSVFRSHVVTLEPPM